MTETQRNQIREKWKEYAQKLSIDGYVPNMQRYETEADWWLNLIEEETSAATQDCNEKAFNNGALAERESLIKEIEGMTEEEMDTFCEDQLIQRGKNSALNGLLSYLKNKK